MNELVKKAKGERSGGKLRANLNSRMPLMMDLFGNFELTDNIFQVLTGQAVHLACAFQLLDS